MTPPTPTDARRDAVAETLIEELLQSAHEFEFSSAIDGPVAKDRLHKAKAAVLAALSVSDRYNEAERVREEAVRRVEAYGTHQTMIKAIADELRAISLSPREPGAGSEPRGAFIDKNGATVTPPMQVQYEFGGATGTLVRVFHDGDAIVKFDRTGHEETVKFVRLIAIPARGEADASVCKDSLRTGWDELGVAPSPSKTEDEAWVEAAKTALFDSAYGPNGGMTGARMEDNLRAAIAAYHLARFGGDPGMVIDHLREALRKAIETDLMKENADAWNQIRTLQTHTDEQSARIAQLEAQVAADRAALNYISRTLELAPTENPRNQVEACLNIARASLQPRSETP